MSKLRRLIARFGILALAGSFIQVMTPANAQVSGIDIDFAAAEPLTYNHSLGGGLWGNGDVNTNIERSLEGEQFACGDKVSYLTKVSAANTTDVQALGAMTVDLRYSFDLDTTGGSGVALAEPVSIDLTNGDTATVSDGGSAVTILNTNATGPIFKSGSELFVTARLTDLEAGEVIIVRTTVVLKCQPGSNPSGNVQAKFKDAFLTFKMGSTPVNPADQINSGERTVPMKSLGKISKPELSIQKTVTTKGGACPGAESITITPTETVRFCYEVTNPSNSGGRLGAPLYNLTSIIDTPTVIPSFAVPLMSGLTDIDGDGQVDDLAAGATAWAYYEVAFDGDKDSTITNLASISGYDSPTGGNLINASDTAIVYVDAPEVNPGISLSKLTNGSDTPTILVGETVTWTYLVTNTGNVTLNSIAVIDDKGVTVVCPVTTLAPSASVTCTGTGIATIGSYMNLATVSGLYETQTVTASDSSSYFGASPSIQIAKSPDNQIVKEGSKASFTILVTNSGNVPLSNIVVTDPLSTACNYTASALAVAGTISYSCLSDPVTAGFVNSATVTALWNSTPVQASDTATVVVDYLPKITVTKSADKASVPESGGTVTFTVTVKNDSVEGFLLKTLVDDKFGNLNGQGTCSTPQTIAAGATYSCTFSKVLKSDLLTPHVNIVTATGEDPEGNPASGSDDASVGFTDVLPDITLSKVANPTAVKWTGDYVNYTFTITNLSFETVTVMAFSDDKYTLSSECLLLIGKQIAPGGSLSCSLPNVLVMGTAGGSFTNTATATAVDNEMNADTATASATVNFWWYGRTPGFWKNKPEVWPSPYLPGNFIQNIFTVPTSLLSSSGVMDLDKAGGRDTLMQGLNFKGGSTLSGGAQILFRAAIAALLNEAYYGADFPIATSTTDLISQVNAVLSTNNRATYVSFASYLDYWNNAVHAAIP